MKNRSQFTWDNGDENRPFGLYRPCSCGCDSRGGEKGVGYLTGSDADGNGFTIWITDDGIFERLQMALNELQTRGTK